ncbi:MAG: phage tail protein [Nitrospira sp. SG-bin2]|uniref:portal protein n=1 Tax=Nitrospira cf. moscoviensis SBR1015 TaxID=96242 RepID=UPI000A0E5049|nr:portal protein [Nitrospira cf. moscoviensis SBR1015]OQW34857.1 MAG: phage tail protein [Nitrospira sp. SG-bin2]
MEPTPSTPAESRYNSLSTFRDPFLNRAWDCSELTIPSLLPRNVKDGNSTTSAQVLPTPWQSMGARGVNNLAARLLMIALPPNIPMFRQRIDEILLAQYQVDDATKTKLESALGKFERAVMTEIEMSGDRAGVFEMIKHLLVAGNCLIHDSKMGFRVYHLSNYVCRRDPAGNPLEIIAHEKIDPVVLPDELRQYVQKDKRYGDDKPVDLYTRIVRTDHEWVVYQEICAMKVPGTDGTYPLDKCPWLPLRFTRVDGEDYGRGYVEEYLGDLRSLEDLTQALVEGARAAAKLLFLVNPNGTTRQKDLAESPNGAIINGNAEEVSTLQAEKFHDFKIAAEQARVIEERLSYAFLLHSAIQRDAERVTTEEIRYMAQELEGTLGGFYTLFAQEWQLPYVKIKIARMQKERRLPQLPKGVVRTTIVTGVEALGRGNDRQKLVNYARTLSEVFGPQQVQQYVDPLEFSERLATADGIDTKGLVPDRATINAQMQQQQMNEMIQKLGPQAIATGGKLMEGQFNGQQGQPSAGQ